MDPWEGLNFAYEALTRVRNPIGKPTSPGRHCRDIKERNPDFKSGFYMIDPNSGRASDAIQVRCDMEQLETCVQPSMAQFERKRWTERDHSGQYFMDDINGKKEFMYTKYLSQLKMLQLQSTRARQQVTYHCLNSQAYGTRFVLNSGDEIDSVETTFRRFTRLQTTDMCVRDNQWHQAVFNIRTTQTENLPITDVLLFDIGRENQQFGIELGEVCFS